MMSFAFVDDAVNGCVLAMERGRRGERYILAGPPVSLGDFVGTLAEVSGRKRPRISLPAGVIALGVDALNLVSPLTCWKPPVTGKGIRQGGAVYDGRKAMRDLELEYTPLSIALSATVNWINAQR
jgi:dihydroflavonol-4-reductase